MGLIRSLRILVNENIPDAVLDDAISHYSRGHMYDSMLQEYGSYLDTTIQQVINAGPLPNKPLVVLKFSENEYRNRLFKFQMSWDEAKMVNSTYNTIYKKLRSLSSMGTLHESEKGLHYLHLDDPELVIQSILEQVRRYR